MSGAARQARGAQVRALAKINLDLRVLAKRADGYHELRTIFQTISLADTLDISFTPGRKTSIDLDDPLGLPGNLAERAARLVMETLRVAGRVEIRLVKRIPMGAGLGGGSSDAAAVLLALPVLAGRRPDLATLCEMGQQLGSDVPFFLLGGRAVGIGRGSELFPLPDAPARPGLLVTPDVHVSTADAYERLSDRLDRPADKVFSFQSQAWAAGAGTQGENDFEAVVFEQHPRLAALKKRLKGAGAAAAMMTGSGSALFGLFGDREAAGRAFGRFGDEKRFRISLVGRGGYRSMWWRALGAHIDGRMWPPRSRYAR
ncbi:MAG TPA: 4-(cytidine 5'-diphospho)-2-C-methyl-D-erythritol kinase [Bryobacteraceae bacterium]|nr:4-diphosphocytidyl-2-C-methyl-D-erythritol kinase [Candidatus Sulfopaludibacter sp. SbA4]HYW46361.1 4-(cytidine 5'-diphospho)-2-C-methyl-D-erythritol kinase [Bryobacteraceae bacterium]